LFDPFVRLLLAARTAPTRADDQLAVRENPDDVPVLVLELTGHQMQA
jgi:hypothetical protein